MFQQRARYAATILLLSWSLCFSMTYDNRFFPFGKNLFSRSYEHYSNVMPELFYIFAHESRSCHGPDQGLFDIYGSYDLNDVAQALETVGKPNPLRSQWRGQPIPFKSRGRIEALGLALSYNQAFSNNLSCGVATVVMNVKSWQRLKLVVNESPAAGPGDVDELERTRRQANEELGIESLVENRTGFGDVDLYVRLGKIWYYPEKFRRIDAGISLGALLPSGEKRDINNAASIPFAANGKAGFYVQADAEFELKEDMKVGIWARLTQRFNKTYCERVPALDEPINYGALVGSFKQKPSINIMLAPYFLLEDIREGLGASVRYVWVHQREDDWCDQRKNKTVKAHLFDVESFSRWIAEYVSCNVFYDFGRRAVRRSFEPRIYGAFDIPVHVFGSQLVSKSYRITLGVEVHF